MMNKIGMNMVQPTVGSMFGDADSTQLVESLNQSISTLSWLSHLYQNAVELGFDYSQRHSGHH
jgi:hypothetical protein